MTECATLGQLTANSLCQGIGAHRPWRLTGEICADDQFGKIRLITEV